MSATAVLLPGRMVWDQGDEYGANRTGGCVVRVEADANGESQVVLLTNAQKRTKPYRPALTVHHNDGRKGAKRPPYEDIGPVARLVRMPVAEVDLNATDDLRDHHKVLEHARHALFAAAVALLPDYFDLRAHDQFVEAFRVLRTTAVELQRGIG